MVPIITLPTSQIVACERVVVAYILGIIAPDGSTCAFVVGRRRECVALLVEPVAAIGSVEVTHVTLSTTINLICLVGVISFDGGTGDSREIGVAVPIALAVVPVVVRTVTRVVETSPDADVVISADVRAGPGRFLGRKIREARAVLVVRISTAFSGVAVAEIVAVLSVDIVAFVGRKCPEPAGVTLSVDAVRAAVVPEVVTVTVLVTSSDVLARAAG